MILSGAKAYNFLKIDLLDKIQRLKVKPTLKAIYLGHNSASEKYLNNKSKKLKKLNVNFDVIHISSPRKRNLESLISKLNNDKLINGIIIQLPFPDELRKYQDDILNLINPLKDVDCLTRSNLGKIFDPKTSIIPATPQGIISLLNFYKIKISGKKVTIVGRSNLVGKPLALSMLSKNATVTICHSKTKNLKNLTLMADIVILATGNPKLFGIEYFCSKQTVIDVGINITPDGKIVGDVDFENVKNIVKNITPVPGGVGPMTIYGLAKNLIHLTTIQTKL